MKKILAILFTILFFILYPITTYASNPSDFPGAQHGIINSLTQNGTTIIASVRFDNFSEYTSTLYNNDCYNDNGKSFQIYNATTGAIVSSQAGEQNCFSLGSPNQTLVFPPLQLATGDYFIHYSGGNGSEWVTEVYSYIAPAPVHEKPMTTSSLAPAPTFPGAGLTIYSDPVTVTLLATADTGYSIETTYYKIDGGAEQTYTAPVTIYGSGSHSIQYWSIDNTGLEELPQKSRSFTINLEGGVINSLVQNGISVDVSIRLDNFATYTSTLYNNDCYNDNGKSFQIYNADTETIVSSQAGEQNCFSLASPNQTLVFPPLQLATGNYFIHYHGGNGTEWITNTYHYTEPVPVHNRPLSTSSLAPLPVTPGNGLTIYSNPVTVTLESLADAGYSITRTNYKLDGGSEQTYVTPFTVSGSGTHSYEYWSVDNTGLEELPHKFQSFIITPQGGTISYINQNGANIDVGVQLNNFLTYTGQLYNNDCYNDPGASFELYNFNTGELISSQAGERHCYSLLSADTLLLFPPVQLSPGTYFIHYHGFNGSEWITDNFTFPNPTSAPTPTPTEIPTPTPTIKPTNTPTPTPTSAPTPTMTPTPTPAERKLTTLAPAKVWVGIENILNIGVKLDLKAEVYKGNTLITSGQVNSFYPGGSGLFITANNATIPFETFSPTDFLTGSELKLKLSVRNACSGSLRNQGVARLWYNDGAANSRFGAMIGGSSSDYFLKNNFLLAATIGQGPKKTIDVQSGAKCSPFKSFGTWVITP